MKLALTSPPAMVNGSKGKYIPPMHLAYIGTSVQNMKDVQVTLIDSGGEGLVIDETVDKILEADPDLIGLSVTSCDVRRSLQLLVLLKAAKPSITIILEGHHPTAFDWLFLEHVPQVDMIMRGEVDLSFPELVRRILKAEPIAGAPGLSYRANGQVIRGVPQVVQDLDAIKFPDRTLFDGRNYFLDVLGVEIDQTQLMSTTAIFTSRGCHHMCTFCSKLTSQHSKIRGRSPENIVKEILQLNTEGYELVIFADENFTYDVNRVKRICELLLNHDLKMRFVFQGTLHHLSQSMLNLMQRAGFDGVIVGMESGSDAVLKRYKKSVSSRAIAAGIMYSVTPHLEL
ncbi:MAG: B12-binding domain-containing radical SAM protein [Deltaproteobacteria bacterium]|nr:B12-binding domain-containing radical SAM protein [Deltaproteobacteria bacterium]